VSFTASYNKRTAYILAQGAKGKSTRMNGFSLKFYPTMWEYIKEDALFDVQVTVHHDKFL